MKIDNHNLKILVKAWYNDPSERQQIKTMVIFLIGM